PFLSRAGLSHWLATVLEPRALRGSDFVVSVSDTQNKEMASRYPWFDGSRMAGIPIGGDPDDFAVLRASPAADGLVPFEPHFNNLSHTGTFLPRAGPLVRTLFRALARLRAASPDLAARVRLNFIRTTNRPTDDKTYRVRPLPQAEGVVDAVRESPR